MFILNLCKTAAAKQVSLTYNLLKPIETVNVKQYRENM